MSRNLLTPFSRSAAARPSYPVPWDTFYEIRDCHGEVVGFAMDEEHADLMVGLTVQGEASADPIERALGALESAKNDAAHAVSCLEDAEDELKRLKGEKR